MFLILIVCAVAMYAFFKTYRKEMNEKKERELKSRSAPEPPEVTE